jgi:alkylation response protein AidB-like acyl-CoA dehydrogenase
MAAPVARSSSAPTVATIVAGELRPLARRIDEEGLYPAGVLRRLGEAGAFAYHTSTRGAGPAGLRAAIDAMTDVGAVCLSTAFCAWCQDALAWYLDRADNPEPRNRYLDAVASARTLGGTGLSNPMKASSGIEPLALKGRRTPGGYRVTGRLPFVSNVEDGHVFAGVFALDDQPEHRVMALLHAGSDGVALARNAHFVALEGTATHTVLIRDAFVPFEDVLADDAGQFIPRIRNGFVLLQAGMGLGIARGAARLMREDGSGRLLAGHLPLGPEAVEDRIDALTARLAAHVRAVEDPARATFLDVLRTRLDITWLALEAAQAAALQSGARGYLAGAEAARRLREAQFVAIVTPSVKHITTELARGDSSSL